SPLFHMENVVVTPHAAGVDLQSRDDMAMSAAQAIISLSRGEWPAEKVVNPEGRVKFRWGAALSATGRVRGPFNAGGLRDDVQAAAVRQSGIQHGRLHVELPNAP